MFVFITDFSGHGPITLNLYVARIAYPDLIEPFLKKSGGFKQIMDPNERKLLNELVKLGKQAKKTRGVSRKKINMTRINIIEQLEKKDGQFLLVGPGGLFLAMKKGRSVLDMGDYRTYDVNRDYRFSCPQIADEVKRQLASIEPKLIYKLGAVESVNNPFYKNAFLMRE